MVLCDLVTGTGGCGEQWQSRYPLEFWLAPGRRKFFLHRVPCPRQRPSDQRSGRALAPSSLVPDSGLPICSLDPSQLFYFPPFIGNSALLTAWV